MSAALPPEVMRVAELLAQGLTDKVIAQREEVTKRTVRRRVARLLSELGASTRFQAGLVMGQRGLLHGSPTGPGTPTSPRPKGDKGQVVPMTAKKGSARNRTRGAEG